MGVFCLGFRVWGVSLYIALCQGSFYGLGFGAPCIGWSVQGQGLGSGRMLDTSGVLRGMIHIGFRGLGFRAIHL